MPCFSCLVSFLITSSFFEFEFFYLDPKDFLPDPSDPGPGSTLFLHMEDPEDWTFGCSIFGYFGIFPSGPSEFYTGPNGPPTRVHLYSPYGGPRLDFWVLYIWIFWILEFFHLDPQDYLQDPLDPGPSGFYTGPNGPRTRVPLVSPYGGPCGLDFWVLYI